MLRAAKTERPEDEKQEIQEAIFSRDEIMDLPLELQTQYLRGDSGRSAIERGVATPGERHAFPDG